MLNQERQETSENLDLGLLSTALDRNMIDKSRTIGFRPINREMSLNNFRPPSSPSSQPHENSLLDVDEDRSEGTSDNVNLPTSPSAIIPTIDEKGQRVCTFDGCTAPPFARQCEFKKHADRHQRPYVCKKPECARLKGFTYQGGLLRHEREIHQERSLFYCPVQKCKRHAQGFTRKENMEEHLRRIHTSKDSIMSPGQVKNEDNTETDCQKRKRDSPNSVEAEVNVKELLREMKRLKEENAMLRNKLAVKSEP